MPESTLPHDSPLRKWLAGHDCKCPTCGYNLRGATTPFCPECGTVIPSPSADALLRLRTPPESLRLTCNSCGHCIAGQDADLCPICGGSMAPGAARTTRRGGRLGLMLIGLAVLSLLCAGPLISRAILIRTGGKGDLSVALLALGLLGIPVALAAAWLSTLVRRPIPAENRRKLAWAFFVVGLVALLAGLALAIRS